MPQSTVDEHNVDSHQQQNLALLKVYTGYRVILCLTLFAVLLVDSSPYDIGSLNRHQATLVTTVYLLINLTALLVILPKRLQLNNPQLFANFIIDVVCLILIIDASEGISSNLGILLAVAVAAGSIMLPAQLAYLLAAIASLMMLADTQWLIYQQIIRPNAMVTAGVLGMAMFITAIFIQSLAKRIRNVQLIAEQRGVAVSRLRSLNESIVKRMRTGILVTDDQGNIELANAAASELLGSPDLKHSGQHQGLKLPTLLMQRLQNWQQQPRYHATPFRPVESGRELQASFSSLEDNQGNANLIFLEDNKRLAQQTQQIKLASLGRLTASIAHEIRNPLGAISHAAQLLAESDQISEDDIKLSEIIQAQCIRMNQVIENVLQLSRRSPANPQKILLSDWLEQFIDDFKQQDEGRDSVITLSCETGGEATVDCSQLTQVLTNLAANGIRYSVQKTQQPSLELHLHSDKYTELPILDIIDDGPGVAEQEQEKLFEPFYTTEAKGSGLGLYISRELCEANQARLDYLRNQQGKSCFRISFPHPDRRLLP